MGYAEMVAFLLRNWKWAVMAALAGLCAFLWWSMDAAIRAKRDMELDKQRNLANFASFYRKASQYAQVAEVTRSESKMVPGLEREVDSLAHAIGVKDRQITKYHRIISYYESRDSVRILRDTVMLKDGEYNTFSSIAISAGCYEGTAYWMDGQDTALVEGTDRTDITIAEYVTKSKGYVKRDVERFFTFKWRMIGSDKWVINVKVMNNCQPDQVWERNTVISMPRKKRKIN